MLAAPSSDSTDNMLQDAVTAAANQGLVRPNDHVVCVMSIKDSLVVKVVTMDGIGARCMRHSHSAQGTKRDSHIHTTVAHTCSSHVSSHSVWICHSVNIPNLLSGHNMCRLPSFVKADS